MDSSAIKPEDRGDLAKPVDQFQENLDDEKAEVRNVVPVNKALTRSLLFKLDIRYVRD